MSAKCALVISCENIFRKVAATPLSFEVQVRRAAELDVAEPSTVAPLPSQSYPSFMSSIVEVEKLALDLPERQRATLAANLLDSLPGILSDEDEGVAEALRRDAEIEADPSQAISLAELDSQIQGRRG